MKMPRGGRLLFLVLASSFLWGWLRPATAQLLGPEFQVNTYTTFFQTDPAVAADGSGNFVVAWDSDYQYGSGNRVYGQRFNSAGSPVGSEFLVNSFTPSYQGSPAVAADGAGNFVVVWNSNYQDGSGSGVIGRRFNSAGSPVGSEFLVNTYTTSFQYSPAVAADGAGNFVVVWNSYNQDGSYAGVFGQRFNSAGSPVGSEFLVNTYTANFQLFPAVAADGSGNFVVFRNSYFQDGGLWGVFGQRFDSAGSRVGLEFQVNTYTTGHQMTPAVAKDGSGNFVVVWQSNGQDGLAFGVFGQQFNSAGSRLGSEFQVNSFTTSSQSNPAVAADGTGNFVVVWRSSYQDGSLSGVFGHRFDSAGSRVGLEFQVNTYTTDHQGLPAVAADSSGNFVVAWVSLGQDGSGNGVFGQRLNSANSIFRDGFNLGDACAWSAAVGGGCP